ncbi:MAG: TIGR00375 family protein [Thermoplasmata archaeon]|nr:MAG: TIGR00375 family protein [Thermoplasmata archaeon]
MFVNADFHIHSRFSGGTSEKMTIENLSKEAKKKGIHVLATGDCLHSQWLKEIKENGKYNDGIFEMEGTIFILSTEVEDEKRVHHLILFPCLDSVEDFKQYVSKYSENIQTDGRPHLFLSGGEILDFAKEVDALIGPSHAFTPWTSLYAYHDCLKDCYGDRHISFLELGLSADTNYADRIKELQKIPFLSNSDSHSPYPIRLAREFNRLEVEGVTWDEIKKAILFRGGRRIVFNAGFPPEEGKYNRTACISCYTHYTLNEAKEKKWKCDCGGRIKKGVKDRVDELADYDVAKHPEFRPPYIHIIPLAEIIAKALRLSSFSKKVTKIWEELMKAFGNEISVLLDAEVDEIKKITAPAIAYAIEAFRNGSIKIHPGGGGKYGEIEIFYEESKEKQRRLIDWIN